MFSQYHQPDPEDLRGKTYLNALLRKLRPICPVCQCTLIAKLDRCLFSAAFEKQQWPVQQRMSSGIEFHVAGPAYLEACYPNSLYVAESR